jgi:hypothetical protein
MTPTLESNVVSDQLARCCVALKRQLKRSPYWAVRNLVCQIDCDRIRVQGTVSSFYLKQVAQSLAAKTVGIECVRSEIVVQSEGLSTPMTEA